MAMAVRDVSGALKAMFLLDAANPLMLQSLRRRIVAHSLRLSAMARQKHALWRQDSYPTSRGARVERISLL